MIEMETFVFNQNGIERKQFDFNPSEWVPFKDKKEINRVARIKREDMEKHPNPEFIIKVVPDADV